MSHSKSYISIAIPLTIRAKDRKRISAQIITIVKKTKPLFKLKNALVLDVGSSSGEVSSHLSKRVKKIICIDIDRNAIRIGKKKFADIKNLNFFDFDGNSIPFPPNKFDLIILRRVIECVAKPKKLLEEIFRVLKPKGLVYFESQNVIWPDPNWDFFVFIPSRIKKTFATLTGKRAYYFATYRNYWQLRKLFARFKIHMITPKILKDPKKYNFTKLKFLEPIGKAIPAHILNFLEPLNRHFIWVLEKTQA